MVARLPPCRAATPLLPWREWRVRVPRQRLSRARPLLPPRCRDTARRRSLHGLRGSAGGCIRFPQRSKFLRSRIRRSNGRTTGLSQVPGMPFARRRQEHDRPEHGGDHRPQGRVGARVHLFAGNEARRYQLDAADPRRLPDRPATRPSRATVCRFPGLKSEHDRDDVIAFLVQACRRARARASRAAPATPLAAARYKRAAINPRRAVPPPRVARHAGHAGCANTRCDRGSPRARMVFLGVGGAIDGQINPVLGAAEGQVVQVTLVNGEGAEHDIVLPDQNAASQRVTSPGASTHADVPRRRHRRTSCTSARRRPSRSRHAGQVQGRGRGRPQVAGQGVDISRDPSDLPRADRRARPETIRVDLVGRRTGRAAGRRHDVRLLDLQRQGARADAPRARRRHGSTVSLKNAADSAMMHSIDLHAATGPGGGAARDPGQSRGEKRMTFKATACPGFTSTTARRRWWPSTSPAACTA